MSNRPGTGPSGQQPFDSAAALAALGNRVHVLRDLAELFLQERVGMVQSVRSALDAENPSETERAVHSLRGAVGYFRAAPLWNVTSRMHAAATQGDLDQVREMLPEFEQVIQELSESLQAFLDQHRDT